MGPSKRKIVIDKKPRLDDALTIRTTYGLRAKIDKIARANNVTTSEVIRQALDQWAEWAL